MNIVSSLSYVVALRRALLCSCNKVEEATCRSPPAVFSAAVEQTTRRDIRRLSLSRCGYLGATEREQQYLSARCRFPLFLRRFPATRDISREDEFNDNVTNDTIVYYSRSRRLPPLAVCSAPLLLNKPHATRCPQTFPRCGYLGATGREQRMNIVSSLSYAVVSRQASLRSCNTKG